MLTGHTVHRWSWKCFRWEFFEMDVQDDRLEILVTQLHFKVGRTEWQNIIFWCLIPWRPLSYTGWWRSVDLGNILWHPRTQQLFFLTPRLLHGLFLHQPLIIRPTDFSRLSSETCFSHSLRRAPSLGLCGDSVCKREGAGNTMARLLYPLSHTRFLSASEICARIQWRCNMPSEWYHFNYGLFTL